MVTTGTRTGRISSTVDAACRLNPNLGRNMTDERDVNSPCEPGKEAPELYALVRHGGGYRLTRKEFMRAAVGAVAGAGGALVGSGVGSTAEAADKKKVLKPTSGRIQVDIGVDPDVLKKAKIYAHVDYVRALAFSPNGNLLASGSVDKTAKLWDMSTSKCVRTLKGHASWVRGVALIPNGKLLASGSRDETIKLWDMSTGKCVRTLKGHTDDVNAVAFSPDGKLLASGGGLFDGTVKLWDVLTGTCVRTLKGAAGAALAVAFSPDGKLLASGSDGAIILWDLTNPLRAWVLFDKDAKEGKLRECRSRPGGAGAVCTCNTIFLLSGGALAAGSVCVCNTISTGTGKGTRNTKENRTMVGKTCTCDQVCSCNTICTCNTIATGGGSRGGGHYWYPNV